MTDEFVRAQQIVEQEQRNRARKCGLEIDEILERYNCRIVGYPIITDDGRIQVRVEIRALNAVILPNLATVLSQQESLLAESLRGVEES